MTQLGLESTLTRDPHLSVTQSDLVAWKNCRRLWMLQVYLGLRTNAPQVTGPLRLGTRVHAALERMYGYGEDLIVAYQQLCNNELQSLVESNIFFDSHAWQKEIDMGRIMLEGFLEWQEDEGDDSRYDVVGVEQTLEHIFDIDGTPVILKGKIDCRVKDLFSGMHLVVDWKTTQGFDRLIPVAHMSEQLLTYMSLERLVHKDDEEPHYLQGARYVMLRKVLRGPSSRPPYYATIEVHHSQTRLRNFYTQLVGQLRDYLYVVNALDAGVDHRLVAYPNPNFNTRWSPYIRLFEMMDDNADVERFIRDNYVQMDPHARYKQSAGDLLSQFG